MYMHASASLSDTSPKTLGCSFILRISSWARLSLSHMHITLKVFRLDRFCALISFGKPNKSFRQFVSSFYLAKISANRLQIVRTMTTEKKPFERLPTEVVPKNYNLTLQPNLNEFTFSGKEVIDVEVRAFPLVNLKGKEVRVFHHCKLICSS